MVTEKSLVEIVDRYFREKGYVNYLEVPLFDRRIDIVAVEPKGKDITAIEVKVKDSRSVFQQALTCRICANRVFVGLPQGVAQKAMGDKLFDEFGIGILSIDGGVTVLREAKLSPHFCPSIAHGIVDVVLGKTRGDMT